tara:strand:+ start:249 stop:500 length:252 start_codon:yes stop_codon:yes gene_type:complete
MEWIAVGLIFAFFVWFAQYNPIMWVFVGFFLLLCGGIMLPPPWSEYVKNVLYVLMAVWVVGSLFGGGRSSGGHDRDDSDSGGW